MNVSGCLVDNERMMILIMMLMMFDCVVDSYEVQLTRMRLIV